MEKDGMVPVVVEGSLFARRKSILQKNTAHRQGGGAKKDGTTNLIAWEIAAL